MYLFLQAKYLVFPDLRNTLTKRDLYGINYNQISLFVLVKGTAKYLK